MLAFSNRCCTPRAVLSVASLAMLLPFLAGCQRSAPAVLEAALPIVTVMKPLTWKVADDFEDTGQTAAVEEVELRARVSGYLVKKHVPDGSEVKKDQVLFTIDPAPYQAALDRSTAELERWQATLERARAELDRSKRLLPSKAISQEDYELSVAQVKVNEAEVKQAQANLKRAQLDLGWTEIRAPFDGRIGKCSFSEGDLIPMGGAGEGTVLATIVSMATMQVYFNVPERTMLVYQQHAREAGLDGRPDHVKDWKAPVFTGLANEKGYPHEGVLDFIDNRVDSRTGTLRVRGLFDNAKRLLTPGLFVRVRVPLGDPKPAVLVPDVAIATDQDQKYVLAVDEERTVLRVPVVLGRQITLEGAKEPFRVIQSGLDPGREVIVNGIQRARVGAKVDATPAAAPTPAAVPAPAVPDSKSPAAPA